MTDLFSDAAGWLDSVRREHLSRYVSYRRDGTTLPCLATVSQSAFETQTDMGVVERHESRDYIVSLQELPVDEPRRGDVIVETLNSLSVEFEVVAPSGAPVWQWADQYRTAYRIHTQAIKQS